MNGLHVPIERPGPVTMNGVPLRWRDTGEPVMPGDIKPGETIYFNLEGECWRRIEVPVVSVGIREAMVHAAVKMQDSVRAVELMRENMKLMTECVAALKDKPRRDWEDRQYRKPKRRRGK